MTILPVKKKREKSDSGQKSVSGSTSDSNRQLSGQSSSGPSSSKRNRPQDDGGHHVTKRSSGAISPSGLQSISPLSSPRGTSSSTPSTSSSSATGHSENVMIMEQQSKKKKMNEPKEADYNSDDEYREENVQNDALEIEFSDRLARRGLIIKEMVGDGACMFRSIAEQIYGDQEMHGQIRELCMDYMLRNKDHFKEFITENYENYIQRKREDNVHGNHVELQAISEMFARPVEVYQYSDEPINVLLPRPEPASSVAAGSDGSSSSSSNAAILPPPIQQNAPLRLSYHRAVHYNAILAPNVPTIGVGLGLPGMIPGAADKDLMTKAMATSELEHIEETMLQDKIDLTDYQRTQADLEDQIARESLMTYLDDLERNQTGTRSSSSSHVAPGEEGPSTSSGGGQSTSSSAARRDDFGVGTSVTRGTGTGLYEEMLAAQSLVPEWDAYTDDVAIAEALLVSQQDFLSQNGGPSRRNDNDDKEEEPRGSSSSGGGPSSSSN